MVNPDTGTQIDQGAALFITMGLLLAVVLIAVSRGVPWVVRIAPATSVVLLSTMLAFPADSGGAHLVPGCAVALWVSAWTWVGHDLWRGAREGP